MVDMETNWEEIVSSLEVGASRERKEK